MREWIMGLVQGVFASLLGELLLALGAGALIAYLRAKRERWAGPVLYGLAGFALIFIIGFTLTGKAPLSQTQPEITPENVQPNIKKWLDDFSLDVRLLPESEAPKDAVFSLVIKYLNGDPVQVTSMREHPGYVVIDEQLVFSPELSTAIGKLSKEETVEVSQELNVELARIEPDTSFGSPSRIDPIHIERRVPIANLTEDTFMSAANEVQKAGVLARGTIILALRRVKPQALPGVQ